MLGRDSSYDSVAQVAPPVWQCHDRSRLRPGEEWLNPSANLWFHFKLGPSFNKLKWWTASVKPSQLAINQYLGHFKSTASARF